MITNIAQYNLYDFLKIKVSAIGSFMCVSHVRKGSSIPWCSVFSILLIFAVIFLCIWIPHHKDHKFKLSDTIHDILSFVIPLGLIYVLLTYVIMMSTCESGSMESKLMTGNTVFYNRLAYTGSEPQRGDIVVFVSHEKNDLLLGKRIIGIPGDHISFNNGCVIVNGKCIDESAYIPNGVKTYCKYEFDVPDNCYFMLGDNRENSYDSRFWNNPYIEKSDLKGKYIGQINFSFEWDIEKKLFPDKGTADNNVSSVYRYSSHNEASSLIP